jgi:hypothetical protein
VTGGYQKLFLSLAAIICLFALADVSGLSTEAEAGWLRKTLKKTWKFVRPPAFTPHQWGERTGYHNWPDDKEWIRTPKSRRKSSSPEKTTAGSYRRIDNEPGAEQSTTAKVTTAPWIWARIARNQLSYWGTLAAIGGGVGYGTWCAIDHECLDKTEAFFTDDDFPLEID